MKKKIFIVLPIYNEEKIIEKVVNELIDKTLDFNIKIILINDGSKDGTKKKIEKFKDTKNIVVVNKHNEGHGKTISYGYEYAIKNDCDYVFQMDSDDQFYTEDIKQFLKEDFNENLIIGERKKRKDKSIRLIITNLMKLIIFIFHGVLVKDANSPFRLIKKSFLSKNINRIKNSIIPNVLMSIIAAKDKSLKFIVVGHKERETGEVSIKKWKLFSFCLKSLNEIICFK